jgi:hypothetical protein
MGYSPDGFPFVGEVPGSRGLWASCSFQGHGMALCWMCARALVGMMSGDGDVGGWFPREVLDHRGESRQAVPRPAAYICRCFCCAECVEDHPAGPLSHLSRCVARAKEQREATKSGVRTICFIETLPGGRVAVGKVRRSCPKVTLCRSRPEGSARGRTEPRPVGNVAEPPCLPAFTTYVLVCWCPSNQVAQCLMVMITQPLVWYAMQSVLRTAYKQRYQNVSWWAHPGGRGPDPRVRGRNKKPKGLGRASVLQDSVPALPGATERGSHRWTMGARTCCRGGNPCRTLTVVSCVYGEEARLCQPLPYSCMQPPRTAVSSD